MQKSAADVGINSVNNIGNTPLPHSNNIAIVNTMQIVLEVACTVWIIGILVLTAYSIISYIRVFMNLKTATLVNDNIFESDKIATPFVFGLIKPRIFIPIGLNEKDCPYILAHEQVHIKRLDYLIKPFAFLVLIIHWFNPVMWISFILMSKDMELCCDERVLKIMDNNAKGIYASVLLSFSLKRSRFSIGSPLAFGESNIKSRIKNILAFKKHTFLTISIITVTIVALMMVLTANPKNVQSQTKTSVPSDNTVQIIKDSTKEPISSNSKAVNSLSNEDIMKKYITDFLTKGYSKYYIINSFNFNIYKNETVGSNLEALVLTTMNSNVPPKDPETVPYIMDAKAKAQKEKNPKIKKMLQEQYEQMAKEYGKPEDSNNVFKLTANLIDGKIDEKSIVLMREIDAPKGVDYVPAEDILPGN
jgi:beta-lactamase regulating signal transducer with metallopeptidase domain